MIDKRVAWFATAGIVQKRSVVGTHWCISRSRDNWTNIVKQERPVFVRRVGTPETEIENGIGARSLAPRSVGTAAGVRAITKSASSRSAGRRHRRKSSWADLVRALFQYSGFIGRPPARQPTRRPPLRPPIRFRPGYVNEFNQ